ncbi:MAG: undecaprenyl-diphosphatase UppP [Anaerolineaceae bacterium]|jgi:undecaprenyl-diphosphatase
MTFLQSIILGIVQGLTEFLPVSSSAHLVLVPYLLNWSLDPQVAFAFDVLVQLGTLGAVIIYFWKDLLNMLRAWINGLRSRQPFSEPDSRLAWLILLATIPAGLAGLLLKDKVEAAFNSPVATAVFLFLTAVLLTATEIWGKRQKDLTQLTPLDAVIVGIFQAIAIFPGVSRSGATISGGMLRGFDRPSIARFSFLMSIPIMIAAGAMAIGDLLAFPNLGSIIPVILIGFLVAAVVGYLAIRWFLGFLKQHSLLPFAIYCAVLAVAVIFVAYARSPA